MSMSLPSDEKRHYVAVMQHTLHAVRTAGLTIEFCAECALADRAAVQKLLQDWSEGLSVSATVAVSPEPVWWHLGDSAETRSLHSYSEVQRFAARLPHRLQGALEVIGCNAANGMPVSAESDSRWLLGITSEDALAGAAAEAIERGIVTAGLGSATLAGVAAAKAVAQLEKTGAVRLWAPGQKDSYVFTVGVHGLEAVGRCAIGYETLFAAVQQAFGVKSLNEAARLFFNDKPADPAAIERIISIVAPQLDSVLAASALTGPVSFACAGLTGNETWFGRAMAQALGLPYWAPELDHFLEHLHVTLASASNHALPSLNLLGMLHLAATHAQGSAAWHPSWGSISRGAAMRASAELRPPQIPMINSVPPPPAPEPAVSAHPAPAHEAPSLASSIAPSASDRPIRTPAIAAATAAAAVQTNGAPAPTSLNATASKSAPSPSPEARSPLPPPPPSLATPPIPSASARVSATKLEPNGEAHPKNLTPAAPKPVLTSAPESRSGEPTRAIAALPATVPTARLETNGAAAPKPVPPTAPAPARSPEPGLSSSPPLPRVPAGPSRSVTPLPIRAATAPDSRATGAADEELRDPTPPTAAVEVAPPPREPVVIVLRKRGYWPHAAIAAALLGAGIAAKSYFDADAIRAAAAREKYRAEEATENAEREVAKAVQQVLLASEQAARADQRARELAAATAKEMERARSETEAARVNAIAQARREADEQKRQLLARELATARAATSPGTLNIAAAPAGAEVSIDGRPAQRAPASIEGLSPGPHAVRVTLAGHVPIELNATITGAKTTDLGLIKLERATGAVAISSEPAAVDFSIRAADTPADADPLRRGRTPSELNDLPTGEYLVRFGRAGWPERTERVTIDRGAMARVATKFQGGTVTINSSPTGATVIQGGLRLGQTPLTLGDLPPRDVTYELTVPGFEPLKVSGTVVAGREVEINGILLDVDRLTTVEEIRTPPRPYLTTPLDFGRVPRSTPPYITVSFIVLRSGSVENVKVLEPVDKKISKRFIEAIAKWKYYPAVSHAGFPVNVRMSIPIKVSRR